MFYGETKGDFLNLFLFLTSRITSLMSFLDVVEMTSEEDNKERNGLYKMGLTD